MNANRRATRSSTHHRSDRRPLSTSIIAASILVILTTVAGSWMAALAGTVCPNGDHENITTAGDSAHQPLRAAAGLEGRRDTTALALDTDPVRGRTTIRFTLPRSGATNVSLSDARGRVSVTVVDRELTQGTHSFDWNASDYPSGLYIVVLRMAGYVETGVLQVGG